jgi:3-deoxy-D-manno-octulosonate 8-phosphate phosphatase (KDO 8-P phosphatase)
MMTNYLVRPNKPAVNWEQIKLLILDCDGVLTDGRIIYGNDNLDLKQFDAADGMGIMLLSQIDLDIAVVSGRESDALAQRCRDLKIKLLHQGVANKLACVTQLLEELELDFDNVIYMGDDWNDVHCLHRAALSVAPQNAHPEIHKLVDMVTNHSGGRGAVRELIDFVLAKKGLYEKAINSYLESVSG